MAKVRVRPETGNLYLDFSYRGIRCREQTALPDSPANRRNVEILATRLKRELAKGTFDYRAFFPDSPRASRFDQPMLDAPASLAAAPRLTTPLFSEYAEDWYRENLPRWRATHADTIRGVLDQRLLPFFGASHLADVTRAEILDFRAKTAKSSKRKGREEMSPSRVNHIMTALRMVLAEGAERYEFATPFRNIKPLRLPKMDIHPFTLDEVNRLIDAVRVDYRPYLTTRFFTGARTGELNGLEWRHIDFDNDLILVRQTIVKGQIEGTKTDGSSRDIPMVPAVRVALMEQRARVPDDCRWAFPAPEGGPMSLVNFTNRVWKPLLRHLGFAPRRPYQTRHTAATLMLSAGENPEWVARVLGHASTEMLFRVYSRYVPNLTRSDGRAFTGLITAGANTPGQMQLPASLAALGRTQLENLLRQFEQQNKESQDAR